MLFDTSGPTFPPMHLGGHLLASYLGILVSNLVVMTICLIAGPRPWSRLLCNVFLLLTGVFLGVAAHNFISFAIDTGGLQRNRLEPESLIIYRLLIFFCIPVVMEFLGLIALRFLYLRPRPSA